MLSTGHPVCDLAPLLGQSLNDELFRNTKPFWLVTANGAIYGRYFGNGLYPECVINIGKCNFCC